jgi:anaerobic selenocysteine-containing dehydrogenase
MISQKQIIKTTCTMDCPDTCTLDVSVENNRIVDISGNKDNPVTNGFICSKVSKFAERVYHKDRILFPMKRVGEKGESKFERISWDEASETIASKFRSVINEFGGEAILPYHYGGSNGMLGDDFLDDYFFSKLGASRIAKTLCATPTSLVNEGMYGKMPGVAFEDYQHAKFILIWGANPKASNIHLVPFLKQAKKNGAFIVVIDPVNNFSDTEIDLHLPVKPGTDLPVALSMINYLNEKNYIDWDFVKSNSIGWETLITEAGDWSPERAANVAGINTDDIKKLAGVYAKTNPAVLRCGWGLERNRNGGQAVAAVMAMPALLNKFSVKSGGFTMSNSGAVKFDKNKIFKDFNWNTRKLNMTQFDDILNDSLNPPIKAMYVYNCNPAATVPNQNIVIKGLKREDLFTVVHEQVFTDTTKYADIVLPAVTFLEQHEVKKSYGNYIIGNVKPVIPRQGESKSNEEVFLLLAKDLGLKGNGFDHDTRSLKRNVLDELQIEESSFIENDSVKIKFEEGNPIQFQNVYPQTEKRKINLNPAVLGDNAYKFKELTNAEFPFQLISPANNKMISSTFGEFNYPEMFATINSKDADKMNIHLNNNIRVFNNLGEVICIAKLSNKIRQGVISIPKGAWQKSSLNGSTSTALCPSFVSDVGGGACFNDAMVNLEKI